jgi:hypothetical protein
MKTGEIYSKQCSSCKQVLSIDNFNKDSKRKDGKQRYCRQCRNKARREHDAKLKAKTGWIVYILPEEHYAGLSNNIHRRISNHACEGKNVTNWYVHGEFNEPELAIIAEALLHLQGYKGCSLKPKGR